MRVSRISRWFAAGIAGTLFAILMLALAAPVAADSLVTTIPGQDPSSNVIVVASPGFIANGLAANPANIFVNNGVPFCTAVACFPPGTVCTDAGCTVPFFGGCPATGCATPICTAQGCFLPTCTIYGCSILGYTAAGPIVGFDGSGHAIVYDVRGGTYDTYTIGSDGKYCEIDGGETCP
ncbi:MAG: hypothetical protein LC793_10110 [Thermomicrobia bacterium]|nr:hypothetical protein [Thermomicrobia bacterium]